MGPRTVISDGKTWKSYDERTNQIIIQKPDKQMERSLFSWSKVKKIKALPVELITDGKYKVALLGSGNELLVYFYPNSNILKSVIIKQNDSIAELNNILLNREKNLNLEIGQNNSTIFDLR